MNINTGLNPYNSNYVNGADMTKLSQSQSLTGSVTDNLKEGEVVKVVAVGGDWYKIDYMNAEYYVLSYLTPKDAYAD